MMSLEQHILEDVHAPWVRCEYGGGGVNKARPCSTAVSRSEAQPRLCNTHKQLLGLAPPKPKRRPPTPLPPSAAELAAQRPSNQRLTSDYDASSGSDRYCSSI